MGRNSRRARAPWDRHPDYARHPIGRARRRWPVAYDGPEAQPPVNRRYAVDFEVDRRVERRRSVRRRTVLDELRQNPIRNGLIGLAVAGTAAPIAVNRYQQALRTNPEHERMMAHTAPSTTVTDDTVTRTWNGMEAEVAEAKADRESFISAKLQEYAEFNLTRQMAEDIYEMAQAEDIDLDVAFGLVRAESSFRNVATSRVGAIGLTQLMPATARWLEPGITRAELRQPETTLRIGFGYLRQLIDKYNGDEDLALMAYNRGPGTVDKILKRGGNPDNGYAKFVRTGKVGSHKG